MIAPKTSGVKAPKFSGLVENSNRNTSEGVSGTAPAVRDVAQTRRKAVTKHAAVFFHSYACGARYASRKHSMATPRSPEGTVADDNRRSARRRGGTIICSLVPHPPWSKNH